MKLTLSHIYKRSMVIGDYFSRFINHEETNDWSASEECATFTKLVYELTEIVNISDIKAADLVFDIIKTQGFRKVEDHIWDDYCRGFIAGQRLGLPLAETLKLAEEAERLWDEDDGSEYGYYQEVIDEVANKSNV